MAQQAVADRVEGARPLQSLQYRLGFAAECVPERFAHNGVDTAPHLARGPAGEGQPQQSRGIDSVQDQLRHPMRKRTGLAATGACNHQQRACAKAALSLRLAVGGSFALS